MLRRWEGKEAIKRKSEEKAGDIGQQGFDEFEGVMKGGVV